MTGITLLLTLATATQAGQADNAALLYYQAFLLYEKPDSTLAQMLSDFRSGKIGSNETIREHVQKNRHVIEYIVKASSMPRCDWGYDYSQGIELTLVNFKPAREVALLLAAEAQLHAEQGDYRTALDRCLILQKVGLHVVDRTLISYLVGISISGNAANRTIQNVLAMMPGDVGTLDRFKAQVHQMQDAFPSLETALTQESQVCAATMPRRKHPW